MVAALRQAGARATFVVEDEAGHRTSTTEMLKVYFDWIHSMLDR